MRTRLKDGMQQPKVFSDVTVHYDLTRRRQVNSAITEPTSHIEALEEPRKKDAMDQEFTALLKNKTRHLVPPDRGRNIINCKWVFKLKKKGKWND